MSRAIFIGGAALALVAAAAAWRLSQTSSADAPFETQNLPPSPAPLCPWREPARDLQEFFPEADHYQTETRILSGRRLELADRLGRQPTGDENALRLYPVYRESRRVGTILVGRVKGECGAIELVLALRDRAVCGLRVQRQRETTAVAAALQDPAWLRSFAGKSADAAWKPGQDIGDVPPEARASAAALADGVRALMIQFSIAANENAPATSIAHH